jgi:DNA-binding NtrC family response regulator
MKEKAKVLIIDDNENMRETLADILMEKGYEVATAKTAREGITAAGKGFYNIHLIDVNLPDKTGIDLLKAFRSSYPVRINIMITASSNVKYAVDALNIGANAYVLKPIDFINLEQIMKDCLKKQEPTLKATEERLAEFMTSTVHEKEEPITEIVAGPNEEQCIDQDEKQGTK